ncbi:twitch domain-containing radical SAM protein [Synechocystis salina LEGE 00031]|uniref:Twitch domain-containing radical SAM protein n=1 Tax=Synechocystis salina LEGE 00031 TaxID=1828736 RepID=A0ABR9VUM2_9SYNC|nr:twitch domain-containing radical SAM protein [Synechocystis salina LEGE 00041]MBE9254741.1 twitch domain-containing radical SAM protein [Synechocystis salina LEGE 00031]
MPFTQAMLLNDGRARLCCRSYQDLQVQGNSLSIHHHTLEEIWNSPIYREIRDQMLAGQIVPACRLCDTVEEEGGTNLRQLMNDSLHLQSLGLANQDDLLAMVKTMASSDNRISPPRALHLWLGNRCNLKCRMCSPHFSSQIALDPVHHQWSGGLAQSEQLLPHYRRGVYYWGWGDCQLKGSQCTRKLASGTAGISFPDQGGATIGLNLQGWNYGQETLTLSLQNKSGDLSERALPSGPWQVHWNLEPKLNKDNVELVLSLREEGCWVEVDNLTITRQSYGQNGEYEPFCSRLPYPNSWSSNEEVLEELFRSPQELRLLQFSGGEPLLQHRFYEVLERLIEGGHASQIELYISTNGMVYAKKLPTMLKEFRVVELAFSLDGYGALQEYIRYPSQWKLVEKNIIAYYRAGIRVSIRVTPQAYNIFGLLDLADWCQRNQFPFYCENILWSPQFLSLDMLPQVVVNEALKNLLNYKQNNGMNRALIQQIEAVISVLKRPRSPLEQLTQLQSQFIDFTKALDSSRSQQLAVACPRLYEQLPYFANSPHPTVDCPVI